MDLIRERTSRVSFEMQRGPIRAAKKLVLCFDGTGNKFCGDDSDSNILKIYRMLDPTATDQCKKFQFLGVFSVFAASLSGNMLQGTVFILLPSPPKLKRELVCVLLIAKLVALNFEIQNFMNYGPGK